MIKAKHYSLNQFQFNFGAAWVAVHRFVVAGGNPPPDVLVVLQLFIKPFQKHSCLLLRRRPWDRHCTVVAHRNMIHPRRPLRPPREHGGRGKVSSLGRWPRKADPEGPQVKHSGHVPKTAFLSYVWEFSLCLKGMWMWGWGWDSSP